MGWGAPEGSEHPPWGNGERLCAMPTSPPKVVAVFSCFGLWIPRSMMVVEMATTM